MVYINELPDGALTRIWIYADDTTAYSGIQTPDFDRLEMTAGLGDWGCIVEMGRKRGLYHPMLPKPNIFLLIATESRLIPLKMNDIRLPECTSFRLHGLVFKPKLGWRPCVQSVTEQASQCFESLFNLGDTLHLRPFCTSMTQPSCPVWSTAPIFGVVLHNWVVLICLIGSRGRLVNLIGPVLSSNLKHLSHRRVIAWSFCLFYKCYQCSQELSSLVSYWFLSVRLTLFSGSLH